MTNPSWTYAGFWVRTAALLLDYIFITLLTLVFAVILNIAGVSREQENHAVIGFIAIALFVGYFVYFTGGKPQGTPGKRICNLRVICKDGTDVGFVRAFLRFVAYIISCAPFYLGFALAGFTREKTALHDLICGTRVVQGKTSV